MIELPKLGSRLAPGVARIHAGLPMVQQRPLGAWARDMACPRVEGHNTTLEDCVIVAGLNRTARERALRGDYTPRSPELAVQVYSTVTGYVSGAPSTDQGTDPLVFFEWWRANSLDGFMLQQAVAINPLDIKGVKLAIERHGIFGVLNLSTENQNEPLFTPDGIAGSWGEHAEDFDSYLGDRISGSSWGNEQAANDAYFTQGFVIAAWELILVPA